MEINKNKIDFFTNNINKEIKISNEQDTILKDSYPDIVNIIDAYGTITKIDFNVESTKIRIFGTLLCETIYLSDDKKIHSIFNELKYEDIIDVKEFNDSIIVDKINLNVILDYLNVTIVNSRKISIKYVMNAKISIPNFKSIDAITNIKELNNTYVKEHMINTYKEIATTNDKMVLKERYKVSSSKPEVGEILKFKVTPTNIDISYEDGETILDGKAQFNILYNSVDGELAHLSFELPFKKEIELLGINDENMQEKLNNFEYSIDYFEKDIKILKDNEEEFRVLDIEVVFDLKMVTYENDSIKVIEDVFNKDYKISLEKEQVECFSLLCKNHNTYNIKEILTNSIKDILQVVDADAKIENAQVSIDNGTSKITGKIVGKAIFIVADDEKPLQEMRFNFDFNQVVDTKGTKSINCENYVYSLKSDIDNVIVNCLNPEEIELRFNITLNLKVLNKNAESVLTNVLLSEEDIINKDLGMFKIHVAQENENVWTILKHYNVGLENVDCADETPIKIDTEIKKGQKILII